MNEISKLTDIEISHNRPHAGDIPTTRPYGFHITIKTRFAQHTMLFDSLL